MPMNIKVLDVLLKQSQQPFDKETSGRTERRVFKK